MKNRYRLAASLLLSLGLSNCSLFPAANGFPEPEMVNIPAGEFIMGCVNDNNCKETEKPAHKVTLKSFKLAKYEVTFAQWDACVEMGACKHKPYDYKWGRGNRPVMNVSWKDAQEYIQWLNQQTGKKYRLASEAEWEYAARAGTTTPYYTGECLHSDQANYDGEVPLKGCPKSIERKQTTEVGSFAPNSWGLYDMHGNVWEWTNDCWHQSYNEAPADGSSWVDEKCSRRVLRGGSWNYRGSYNRSSIRYDYSHNMRLENLGFRLAL